MNPKKAILRLCLSLMVLTSLGITHSYAGEVEDFAPVYKLRSDLQCWPSYTNLGANSGTCRSKAEFLSDLPPVFWEDHTETKSGVTTRLITYWVYFSNQPKCSAIAGGDHVDDWEKITVHLEEGVLKHVTYNQHNGRLLAQHYAAAFVCRASNFNTIHMAEDDETRIPSHGQTYEC